MAALLALMGEKILHFSGDCNGQQEYGFQTSQMFRFKNQLI